MPYKEIESYVPQPPRVVVIKDKEGNLYEALIPQPDKRIVRKYYMPDWNKPGCPNCSRRRT